MRKFWALALAAFVTLGFVACSSGGDSAASTAPQGDPAGAGSDSYTIAIALNALDEFQTEWFGYFTEYLEGLGHTVQHTNAEGNLDKQLSDVDALIQTNPDVIVITAVDTEGIVPAFEACAAAGIPTIDNVLNVPFEDTVHLVLSQYELGRLQAEWANDWLEKNPDEIIYCCYLWGAQGMSSSNDRYDGFVDNMADAAAEGRFVMLAEKVANWLATEAMNATEDWVQAYPEMNFVVAMSDEMAIAATNVVEASGKHGEILVLGLDGSPNAQDHIRQGVLVGSSFIPRRQMAEVCADYAITMASGEGESLVGQTFDLGDGSYAFLTLDNIDAELAKYN